MSNDWLFELDTGYQELRYTVPNLGEKETELAVIIDRERTEMENKKVSDEILAEAIDFYGKESQKKEAIGEIGEFLTLFGREVQGRATEDMWIDEIADVMVMMRQMALIYGKDAVEKRIRVKVGRLKNMIGIDRLEKNIIA